MTDEKSSVGVVSILFHATAQKKPRGNALDRALYFLNCSRKGLVPQHFTPRYPALEPLKTLRKQLFRTVRRVFAYIATK